MKKNIDDFLQKFLSEEQLLALKEEPSLGLKKDK